MYDADHADDVANDGEVNAIRKARHPGATEVRPNLGVLVRVLNDSAKYGADLVQEMTSRIG